MKIAVSQMNDNDATLIKVKIVPCIFDFMWGNSWRDLSSSNCYSHGKGGNYGKGQSEGVFRIALKQGKEYIVVTGKVINNVFDIF